jgi:hypothetical protein
MVYEACRGGSVVPQNRASGKVMLAIQSPRTAALRGKNVVYVTPPLPSGQYFL